MKNREPVTLQDVTLVTRNVKVAALEVVAYAAVLYAVTHPDRVAEVREKLAGAWEVICNHVAFTRIRQDIRELPETDG